MHILRTDKLEVKKEALWTVVNITSGGSPDHIKAVVDAGAVDIFCKFLSYSDLKLVETALDGLSNVLKVRSFDVNYHRVQCNLHKDCVC